MAAIAGRSWVPSGPSEKQYSRRQVEWYFSGFPRSLLRRGRKDRRCRGPPLMTRSGSESWTRKGIQLQTTLAVVTSRIHSGLLGTEWLACSSCEGGFDIGDLLHETKTARDTPESKLLVEVGNSLGERIDDD